MTSQLTIDQTDEILRNASRPEDGAIEEAEATETSAAYFFESGSTITVCRRTGIASR